MCCTHLTVNTCLIIKVSSMGKTMYFLRKRSSPTEEALIKKYDLKACFQKRREKIFKNNDVIIAYRAKYVTVLIYNAEDIALISEIKAAFS